MKFKYKITTFRNIIIEADKECEAAHKLLEQFDDIMKDTYGRGVCISEAEKVE